jgi:nitrite reductase/ring-hydroxylating ferredoxin subunit
MVVLEFNPTVHNYFVVGGERFFVLETCSRGVLVCQDRCPHRGGPLHLGRLDCRTRSLTCPWHETVFTERALSRRGVPCVSTGRTITAVFPGGPETRVEPSWKWILANDR